MDWLTRATLWIAALVMGAYFVWAFLDCVLDATCKERCESTGVYVPRGSCSYHWAPKGER
jgi:hypothetical protein